MRTLWPSPEAGVVLYWVLPSRPDAEPRRDCPTGTGRLWAVPIGTPVLLYKHCDGAGKSPSPASHKDLSQHADRSQLGEMMAVPASQVLMHSVAASMPQNRKLTAAAYLSQMYHWVLMLASVALDWTPDGNLPYGQSNYDGWVSHKRDNS